MFWVLWPIVGWQQQVLLKMEGRGVLQDLIPNVGQLELAYVPIMGWIIDPDVQGFLDGPGNMYTSLPIMEKLSTLMQ